MNVAEFESTVWDVEGVRLVIRAPTNTVVGDYTQKKANDRNDTINEWLEARVRNRLGDLDFSIINGAGEPAHRGQKMEKLRQSYTGD